ncbi:larval cuticle protein A2B-like [Ischnura elegans]|uniref:larval cuticle protein A2B-like n=1 Tax=Ischnura elegans TaxID=197161 RepID=UPI001ED89711|nr:larval cuticle protein A2B-like [Ischnura elegans]
MQKDVYKATVDSKLSISTDYSQNRPLQAGVISAMALKVLIFAALVAAASAGYLSAPAIAPLTFAAAPVAKTVVAANVDYHNPHPQYEYSYGVSDAHTGDQKSAQESRNGDVVHGSYSLVEPDGTRRTVEYVADHVNGFNAIVHRQPAAAVAKVAVPVSYAAAAPISFAAPVAKFAAPAISYAAPSISKIAFH